MNILGSLTVIGHRISLVARQIASGVRTDGFIATFRKGAAYLAGRSDRTITPAQWIETPLYTEDELEKQRSFVFSTPVKISLVADAFGVDRTFVSSMVSSVIAQTYSSWELCLSGITSSELSVSDARIVYGDASSASGDYICCLGVSDILHPSALYSVMKKIISGADFIYTDELTFFETPSNVLSLSFKPDYAPDNLNAVNYIGNFFCFSRSLGSVSGDLHDTVIKLTSEATSVVHIPHVLYCKRSLSSSLEPETLRSVPIDLTSPLPKVSIIIPNYEHISDLRKCVTSILEISTYPDFEIVIVENNSKSPEIFEYYDSLKSAHSNVRVVTWSGNGFNWSTLNNLGVREASGDYLLFLNNDTQVITPDWIEQMMKYGQRPDVGIVGAMLYYPNDTVQHAGIVVGMLGTAQPAFNGAKRGSSGYMSRLLYAQDLSAVTGACMLVRRSVWESVGGFDEKLAVSFNDIDFCLSVRSQGYLVVWTPFAELYHFEFRSRGLTDSPEKIELTNRETAYFKDKWKKELEAGDPYYNPNLSLDGRSYTIDRSQRQ